MKHFFLAVICTGVHSLGLRGAGRKIAPLFRSHFADLGSGPPTMASAMASFSLNGPWLAMTIDWTPAGRRLAQRSMSRGSFIDPCDVLLISRNSCDGR
uniref:Putative secreted peptide n=1 Tax=Anopheles braziliensis TaxID=58242 RepID=A0A2M3ZWF2_9DIPT